MKKSAFISDIIFAFAVVFLPALCFFRYLRLPMTAALLFAAAAGILAALPVWFFLDKKRDKLCLKKRDEEEKEKLLLHLALSTEKQNAEYFRGFFERQAQKEAEDGDRCETAHLRKNGKDDEKSSAKESEKLPVPKKASRSQKNSGISPAKKDETLSAESACKLRTLGGLSTVETEEKLYFPLFTVRPVDGDGAAAIVRVKSEKQKCLLCGELSPEAEKLSDRFSVETTTGNDVYRMLKKEDFLPEHYLCDGADAPKKKKRLHVYFSKSNSRHFLLGGVLILLTSLITPFPLYYLIFGSVLILSSIFVRIFGYR